MKKLLVVGLIVLIVISFAACKPAIKIEESTEPTSDEVTAESTESRTAEPTYLPLLAGDIDDYKKAILKLDYEEAYNIVNDFINENTSADLSINKYVQELLSQAKELAADYEVDVDDFEGTGSITLTAVGDWAIAKYGFNNTGFYIAYLRVGSSVMNINSIKVKVGEGDIIEYMSIGSYVTTKEIQGLGMYSESVWINTSLDELERISNAEAVTVRFIGDSNEDQEVSLSDIEILNKLYKLYSIHFELLENIN